MKKVKKEMQQKTPKKLKRKVKYCTNVIPYSHCPEYGCTTCCGH